MDREHDDDTELSAALEEYAALQHPLERLSVDVILAGEPQNAPEADAQTWSLLGAPVRPDVGRAINYQRANLPESWERVLRVADRIVMALPDPYDANDLLRRLRAAEVVREAEESLRDEDEGENPGS